MHACIADKVFSERTVENDLEVNMEKERFTEFFVQVAVN